MGDAGWGTCMKRSLSVSRQLWWTLLIIASALLVPLFWSFLHLETGTPGYAIAQFNLILLVSLIIGCAILIYIGWEPF